MTLHQVTGNATMNGEIPSVPITTLAGVATLTDLLPELPLPTPVPHTICQSLLYNEYVTEDARKVLMSPDQKIIVKIVCALKQTSTGHIELNDSLARNEIEGELPDLVKSILTVEPLIFGISRATELHSGIKNVQPFQQNQQQPSPFQAGQVSPCPPGSPARYSRQIRESSLSSQGHSALNSITSLASTRSSRQVGVDSLGSQVQATVAPLNNGVEDDSYSPLQTITTRKKSSREPIVVLEPLKSTKLPDMAQPKIRLTRIDSFSTSEIDRMKLLQDNYKKGSKRSRDEEINTLEEIYGDFAASLGERVKRRRKGRYDNSDEDVDTAFEENLNLDKKTKKRRLNEDRSSSPEGQKQKKDKRLIELSLSTEELMETGTFKRFYKCLDIVVESAEDVDINMLNSTDDDTGIMSESLVSQRLLVELASEADKLKSMGVMKQVPYRKLVKVMTILQLNIKDGCKMIPVNPDDNKEEELWRELTTERVASAVDASQAAISIMTAPSMPKQVYLEDVIERSVMMVKTQLLNTIFPEFDPVYRIDPKSKHGYQSNMRMKRAKVHGAKSKSMLYLYFS